MSDEHNFENSSIKVSIITPTFNRYEALSKNIESIKNQGRVDIEHIIIDNLSNDGTKDLVENYINTADHRVVYIRERDSGIYNAMNKGIRKAKGEWLHFLNSDDQYIDSKVLGRFVRHMEEFDEECTDIACGAIIFGEDKENGKERSPKYYEKTGYHEFPHQGTFIKRRFFKTNGLYDERYRILADSIYNALHYHKAQFLILPFIVAFMKSGGISSSGSLRAEWEIMVTGVFFHRIESKGKWRLLKKFLFVLLLKVRGAIKKLS